MKQRIALAGALAAGAALYSGSASATDAMRFPDNGTEQMGRGGAWVARASNPLATLYNPAALPTQKSGVLLDVNAVFYKECFTRAGDGSTVRVGTGTPKYPETCNANSGSPQPLPSLALAWRVTDKLGVGFSVSPPSLYGHTTFDDTVPVGYTNQFGQAKRAEVASPQRYMLLSLDGVVLNQTFSAGYSITDRLHFGAGFIWGVGSLTVTNATQSVGATAAIEDPTADVWARVNVADWFIPGVVVGALYSPIDQLDIGLTVTAQEAFDAHGDISLKQGYWGASGSVAGSSTPTESSDVQKGLAHFRLPNPLDVRLGARFHLPRNGRKVVMDGGRSVRDPLVDDVFDVEVDGSYTRNGAYQSVYLRFPQQPDIPVRGTPGIVPKNADVPLNLKGDTIGARVGGDYNVLPGQLALRAGAWFEPSTQRAEDLNVTVVASQRIGLSGGVTYRIGPVDIEAGYMHVFFETQDNGGKGRILALSGSASATPPFRSSYAVNGGKLTASANIVSLGGTMRF